MEAQERQNRMYDNPVTLAQKSADDKRAAKTPSRDLAVRHLDETAEMKARHVQETRKLRSDQAIERDGHLGSSRPLPADFASKQKAASKKLNDRHESERGNISERHKKEKTAVRDR